MLSLRILEAIGLYRPLDHAHKRFERLAKRCNEIEAIFWSVGYFELSKWGQLTPQENANGYRLDFALVGSTFKAAIEIDGHDSHKTKEQRTADYRRERHLKRRGWRFIRFTGSEMYTDPQGCVRDVVAIVRGYNDL
jgi:very-short-patch-repair endonuclease